MAKKRRRLSVKMKRTLRITAAVLFLVSAVGVALIPQRGTEAAAGDKRVTLEPSQSSIPIAKQGVDTVYTTGDGMFQFCYLEKGSSGDRVAVILGYDYERSLEGGTLAIPDTMDAYIKYTHSQGTEGGYVAVGRHGKPLYYPTYTISKQEVLGDDGLPLEDEDGNKIYEDVANITGYLPCLYSDYDKWIYANDEMGNLTNQARDPKDFYYLKDGKTDESVLENFLQTIDQTTQRLKDAEVAYISNQHVVKDSTDNWKIEENAEGEGIFSKATNITKLITGSKLLGIGNYAFYNCASLQSIELGDGANTIGNYAFANCVNMKSATFPLNSSIRALGDHVFYNCRSLEDFTVPVAVSEIGDSAFEGCTGMIHIDLNGGGQQVLLESLGDDVFKNCTALEELKFPAFYSGEKGNGMDNEFKLNWVDGCVNLKYIQVPNTSLKLTINDPATYDDFKKMVVKEFYFEGSGDSETHRTATRNNFAFKYLGEERYEKINGTDGDNTRKQTVFQVNNHNELIYFFMGEDVETVDIPDAIGPYNITVIGSDSFQGKHNLKKITIPASIEEIKPDAFKGCHRLTDVIFEENSNIQKIGDRAFATQVVDEILDTCTLEDRPSLSFTGEAVKGNPIYEYAMNPVNKINNNTQPTTYVTFYTGWPSNLTVRYNPETKKNELIDYIAADELMNITKDSYPYFTDNYYNACLGARALHEKTTNEYSDTEDARAVLESCYNLNLPDGIESVKEGLISGLKLDAEGNPIEPGTGADKSLLTFTSEGLVKVDPYMFKGCYDESKNRGLIGVYINGITSEVGDYAFEGCEKLEDVDIHSDLTTMGKLPFRNCFNLTHVDFGTNPNFDCKDSIIFENNPSTHSKIIEVLQSRGVKSGTGNVTAEEMKGVSEMRPEAFKDCDGIMSVDFTEASLTEIPESAFENTPELYSVKLNNGIKSMRKNAFKNSGVRYLEIPNSLNVIDNSAFENDSVPRKSITFYCEEDSPAAAFASNYDYIFVSAKPITFKVCFYDEDGTTLLETVYVNAGEDAKPSVTPTKPGYTFKAWFPAPKAVTSDMNTYATYESETEVTFTVTFVDYDDTVLYIQHVKVGQDAITPVSPTRSGYVFTGWRPAFTNVQSDITTYAQYEKDIPGVNPGSDSEPNSGSGSNPGSEPNSSGSGSNPGSEPNSDSSDSGNMDPVERPSDGKPNGSSTSGQLYTVIVKDGSGSGSYAPGATVIVAANDAPEGKTFDKWTVDNEKVTLASTSIAATTFVMPSSNVTVTANYKEAAKNPNNSSSSNNGTNSSNSTSTTKPNTTVTITKPGFSNEGLASAVVSGSTDNYILKITDSATAKKEVEDALEAMYGSTKNLKYLAMDISLYDSTGQKKIENTDDLKVTVTMPIPDELVPYAGNNRVAYVINGKIVELSPKFTTINGVSCISFVAPHFSPYTIYVDTTNLTATGIQDYTPKTGDGISPKWFLAAALLCVSAFLFIKRDKKSVKVKAKN